MVDLPANFGERFERVGLGHLYLALARLGNTGAPWVVTDGVSFGIAPRFPEQAHELGRAFLTVADGELVDPELDVDALCRHVRLQSWTLKPAQGTFATLPDHGS